jgi:hypothetical protein
LASQAELKLVATLRGCLRRFLAGTEWCRGTVTEQEDISRYLWELPDDVCTLHSVTGILLGYPWTYCFTTENVNAASSQLSLGALTVFRHVSVSKHLRVIILAA